MKYLKGSFFLFLATAILSVVGVNAATYRNFVGVNIPNMQRPYTSSASNKTSWSEQSAYKVGAIDSMSGDERAIQARTNGNGSISSYVTLPKGSEKTIPGNTVPGSYALQLRAETWLPTSASFSGHWYLDK